MTRREIFNKIFNAIDLRDQKVLMMIGENDFRMKGLMHIMNKDIDKLEKIKGILKLEKGIKKAKKRFSDNVNKIYDTLNPSHETFIFHCLLDANDSISYIAGMKTKLIELTHERTGTSLEELETKFHKSKKNLLSRKFDEAIEKEIKIIDARTSKFLNRIVKNNDGVINQKNLNIVLDTQKNTVEIVESEENKNYKMQDLMLKDNLRSIAVGITTLEVIETSFSKKEQTQLKYNFTRLKTITLDLIKYLNEIDKRLEKSEFKNIILKSFELEREIPTIEDIEKYEDYLKWLKKKGKIKSEYELLKIA